MEGESREQDCDPNCDQVEEQIRRKAFALLTRREYSVAELTQKLNNLASKDTVDSLVQGLVENGLLSDERFSEMICRSRVNQGKGPIRIRYELEQHKISPDIIDDAMSIYEGRWAELAQLVRQKKFGSEPPGSYKERAKQMRFLQQRGFNAALLEQWD